MTIGKLAVFIVAAFVLAGCGDGVTDELSDAITSGNVETVHNMLSQGTDPNTVIAFKHPDFAGGREVERTPLVAAAVYGHAPIVKLLLDYGASVTHPGNAFAICPAVAFGYADIVRGLISAGIDVNPTRKCGRKGNMSPLQFAEARGDAGMVNMLVAAGATR